jgi:hypothetical protein
MSRRYREQATTWTSRCILMAEDRHFFFCKTSKSLEGYSGRSVKLTTPPSSTEFRNQSSYAVMAIKKTDSHLLQTILS